MIEFYKFAPQFGTRDASPFCLRLMTYLRLAEVPHNTHEIMDPRKAPKQKMPFIIDEGKPMGDSEQIITYLKSKYGDPLGKGLTDQQRAITHAFNVMFAERYYWAAMIYPRWVRSEHRQLLIDTWFGMIPKLMRGFITKGIFKDIAKAAQGHGIGRHSEAEIYALGLSDIKAVEAQLGDKDFLLDNTPREVDATAYAFLVNTAGKVFVTPLSQYVDGSEKLMAYIKRVEAAAFG